MVTPRFWTAAVAHWLAKSIALSISPSSTYLVVNAAKNVSPAPEESLISTFLTSYVLSLYVHPPAPLVIISLSFSINIYILIAMAFAATITETMVDELDDNLVVPLESGFIGQILSLAI